MELCVPTSDRDIALASRAACGAVGCSAVLGGTNLHWVQRTTTSKGWGLRGHLLGAEMVGWVGCKELDLS